MRAKVLLGVLSVLLFVLTACHKQVYVPIKSQRTQVELWRDTVIMYETDGDTVTNTTVDTVSELFVQHAWSRACVENGILTHTLSVAPKQDSVIVQYRETIIVDSVPYIVPQVSPPVEVVPRWVGWMVLWSLLATVGLMFLLFRKRSY